MHRTNNQPGCIWSEYQLQSVLMHQTNNQPIFFVSFVSCTLSGDYWHFMPMSSWWPQSCFPHGSCLQSKMLYSRPVHLNPSDHMVPLPPLADVIMPPSLPSIRHTTLAVLSLQSSLHTVPHSPSWRISNRPSIWWRSPFFTKRISSGICWTRTDNSVINPKVQTVLRTNGCNYMPKASN